MSEDAELTPFAKANIAYVRLKEINKELQTLGKDRRYQSFFGPIQISKSYTYEEASRKMLLEKERAELIREYIRLV